VLVGMAIFAISQNVTFATTNFWIWWPEQLRKLGELFRSTGRFIWPLYYVLFIAGLFLVARRFSPRTAVAILASVVVIQAIDLTPGWAKDRAYLQTSGPTPATTLVSPFWTEAAKHYQAVRFAPHDNNMRGHANVATMALQHGLVTDAVYLSRTSHVGAEASKARIAHGVATGEWPSDTLFIFTDEAVARQAAATLDRSHNTLARVDGVVVLAPGWTGCTGCGATTFE
jgi:hypothetical protein